MGTTVSWCELFHAAHPSQAAPPCQPPTLHPHQPSHSQPPLRTKRCNPCSLIRTLNETTPTTVFLLSLTFKSYYNAPFSLPLYKTKANLHPKRTKRCNQFSLVGTLKGTTPHTVLLLSKNPKGECSAARKHGQPKPQAHEALESVFLGRNLKRDDHPTPSFC